MHSEASMSCSCCQNRDTVPLETFAKTTVAGTVDFPSGEKSSIRHLKLLGHCTFPATFIQFSGLNDCMLFENRIVLAGKLGQNPNCWSQLNNIRAGH